MGLDEKRRVYSPLQGEVEVPETLGAPGPTQLTIVSPTLSGTTSLPSVEGTDSTFDSLVTDMDDIDVLTPEPHTARGGEGGEGGVGRPNGL